MAVVFQSGEGTGKGIFVRAIGRICGRHFTHISQSRHLTGQFNAHLRDTLLLFADEALFAADRANEGTLKAMVSEPTAMTEQKFRDPETKPSFLRVIMATNESWSVPAGPDARRFFIPSVSDAHKSKPAYFDALQHEIDTGGLEAFLFDMLALPLDGFNPRKAPVTEGLAAQKLHSLRGPRRWWADNLMTGEGMLTPMPWGGSIAKRAVYSSYRAWQKDNPRMDFQPANDVAFWKELRAMCPDILEQKKRMPDGSRQSIICLPSLDDARVAFEGFFGGKISWGD